jgi:streptogramin lyase
MASLDKKEKISNPKNNFCFLALVISISFLFLIVPQAHGTNAVTPTLSFGSQGSGQGQLDTPRGIAVDDSGNVYVADNRNHRVEVFDSSGKYVSEFDKGGIPEGIAIYDGNIYVVDRNNTSVEKFSPNGTLLSSFGSPGTSMGQLSNPERIAIDSSGNIYIADTGDIQKFNSKGISISQFFANATYQCCLNVMGIAIDTSNNIYVADLESHKIIKFSPTGSTLSEFNSTFSVPRISSTPQDVAVDTAGNIYVADTYNGRIVKLDSTGHTLSAIAISGVPVGLAIKDDKVYATDLANGRVDMFLTSQFVNNGTSIGSNSTQSKEIQLNQNSTALDAAIKLASSSPQFQSLVKGYNYTFSSDFEESGPLSTGGIGLTDHGFAFELYSGPVIPGKAVKVVEVLEDPTLTKILKVISYLAVYEGGPAIPSVTPTNSTVSNAQNNTLLSPLEQFKTGTPASDVKCNVGLQLVFKAEDGSPACVKPEDVAKLVARGWAVANPSKTENTNANNPFGITALVAYNPPMGCPPGNNTISCPLNNFNLKINSNSTAYLLGYNICDGYSCAKSSNLSVLLQINSILNPNYTSIGLPVDLKWSDGDKISIKLEASSSPDNKTSLLVDLGNSTIVP